MPPARLHIQNLLPHQIREALNNELTVLRLHRPDVVDVERREVLESIEDAVDRGPQRAVLPRRCEGRLLVRGVLGGEAQRAEGGGGLELGEEVQDGGEGACGDLVEEEIDEVGDRGAPDVNM